MRIFKFGGASVKDAQGVKNLVKVLQTVGYENTLLVVSAMGKTTNALEQVVKSYFENADLLENSLQTVKENHYQMLVDLFDPDNNRGEQHPVFWKIDGLFAELSSFLARNKSPNYSFVYDQVVGFGELLSTTIIHHYLLDTGIKNTWLDVRNLIKTDMNYRDGNVNWEETQLNISEGINTSLLNITQGFLGSDPNNFTVTLGREGSDYTAAIFAYCLEAESVTIWKDVPGVLNADPRYFDQTQLLHQISYSEAIELAFYGASVIHPKTLQPLQRKEIPLFVKSFVKPEDSGTAVSKGIHLDPPISCFIVKKAQVLLSLSSLDFSFIMEEHISEIFSLLHRYKMKVDLIQNSAISFSVCVDNKYDNLGKLVSVLKERFQVQYYENVSLYTIRHATQDAIGFVQNGKDILLKQRLQDTVQLVVR
ncbi:aspartate kinase [Ascidiimonas aurantiaca]|uniref:aspartate kinase n=1 Tax=Ascidiimonas aurantiaca TaxID=1685432 RepID=UPI0030EF8604